MVTRIKLIVLVLLLSLALYGGYTLYMRYVTRQGPYQERPTAAAVITQIQSLARLQTMTYTVEKIIDVGVTSQQGFIQDLLFGDKLLLIATGEVTAGIDLSRLTPADVTMSDDSLTVRLPAPEIFTTRLDEPQTRVYDRKTGLLAKPDQDLESEARKRAVEQIRSAACTGKILERANESAVTQVTALMKSVGISTVQIIITTPPNCN